RPAARARTARQRPLGHLPEDLHVNDLRPPRLHGIRAVQGRAASTAFRRRIRGLRVVRIRVPFQAFALMTGLPAALAVLAALPLGLLPRFPGLFPPDPLLRARL